MWPLGPTRDGDHHNFDKLYLIREKRSLKCSCYNENLKKKKKLVERTT